MHTKRLTLFTLRCVACGEGKNTSLRESGTTGLLATVCIYCGFARGSRGYSILGAAEQAARIRFVLLRDRVVVSLLPSRTAQHRQAFDKCFSSERIATKQPSSQRLVPLPVRCSRFLVTRRPTRAYLTRSSRPTARCTLRRTWAVPTLLPENPP